MAPKSRIVTMVSLEFVECLRYVYIYNIYRYIHRTNVSSSVCIPPRYVGAEKSVHQGVCGEAN